LTTIAKAQIFRKALGGGRGRASIPAPAGMIALKRLRFWHHSPRRSSRRGPRGPNRWCRNAQRSFWSKV